MLLVARSKVTQCYFFTEELAGQHPPRITPHRQMTKGLHPLLRSILGLSPYQSVFASPPEYPSPSEKGKPSKR
ncbi:hypothetical protein AXF42_Ash002149 [Apostasia shenzhenica]|uniref:Uncharacterized protein n=1 Tax=Apostasia shenzhenica TaxID=1088818 RepID=A0A2I0AN06_9ASPA|nr:hypothetical protein AXF42_Ash002149 [Apostasia shenzhenica]